MRHTTGTVLVIGALLVPTSVSAQEIEFTDVEGTTHEESILAIVDAGVTSGYPDGTFRPGNGVTRGQLATFFTTALELPPGDATVFSDVAGHTHEASIGSLVASEITSGYPDGTFRPDQTITRGQLATFLAAGFELPDDDNVYFEDVRDTTHADGIAAVAGLGLVAGYPDSTFRPDDVVTRGQMATFLARAMGLTAPVAPPDPIPEPEPSKVPLAPSGTTFGNGIHTDLATGTYRSAGADGCYWARLSGLGGELADIITNEITNASTIVTIDSGDAGFESTRCATWAAVQDTYPSNPANSFGDGSYVVGEHIEPGTYRTDASDGCYWARLSGFSGQLADIRANGLTNDSVVVSISADDVGFQAERCGTWTRD